MEYQSNNEAVITGTMETDFVFSHEICGEKFYTFTLQIPRLSETFDHICVTVSERLLDEDYNIGDKVDIHGQFRSYNTMEDGKNHLLLTAFAKDIARCGDDTPFQNSLYLNGFICTQPVYRTTPFGREITDLLLAVNRSYKKSDYIPIIAWGRNARYARYFNVGDNIKVWGRIQSRTYQKRLSEDEVVTKTAYEVSINRLERVEPEADENEE